MSPTTVPCSWKLCDGMSMLNVSMPTMAGPLSHAFTVKVTVLATPASTSVPVASNSAPWLGVAQKPEVERNALKAVALSVLPVPSTAENLPCTPVASLVTSKVKVTSSMLDLIMPTPLSSPVCGGGGWFHACSLGLSGSRASLHAAASASSAAAATETLREMVRFMGAPLQERRVRKHPWQNADRVSRAQQRAATAPDGAQPQ